MLTDLHMHTPCCGHAVGEPAEYLARALDLGLDEIGFTEHSPFFFPGGADLKFAGGAWITPERFEQYLSEIEQLRIASPIPIRLGAEVDFVPGVSELIPQDIRKRLDYCIGSIHFAPQWEFDYFFRMTSHPPEEAFQAYFELAKKAVLCGQFDCLAHLNLIWREIPVPGRFDLPAAIGDALELARRADLAIEINTRSIGQEGYDTPELFHQFIRLVVDSGCMIMLGSDAHQATEVGRNFTYLTSLLKSMGCCDVVSFERGRRIACPLDEG